MKTNGVVSGFLKHHFRHFNAATLVDAAEAYRAHLDSGKKMLLAMGGAMSTAEIGLSLAEMIRQDKIHAVSCSANNLEEDIFNLVAHDHYVRIPHYRDLTPADERKLLDQHLNRVTDTCIPEHEAIRKIEHHIFEIWSATEKKGDRKLPYEYFYDLVRSGVLKSEYQIDPKDAWVLAAAEKNIPIFTPGWEDSTLGNIFTSYCLKGELKPSTMKSGVEQMMHLTEWYREHCADARGLLPDRRRDRRRLPDLRRADAPAGHGDRRAVLGVLLPDHRHQRVVRLVLRRQPHREDHLGQARRDHPQVRHQLRRHHRRPPDLRHGPGGLSLSWLGGWVGGVARRGRVISSYSSF